MPIADIWKNSVLPRQIMSARFHRPQISAQGGMRNHAGRQAHQLYTFRDPFATHLLQAGRDIRTVQELLRHNDVKTTRIYTHVIDQHHAGTASPLDALPFTPTYRQQA